MKALAALLLLAAFAVPLAQGTPKVDVAKLDYGLTARALAPGVWVVEGANADFGIANGCNIVKVTKDGDAFKAEAVHSSNNLANHHGGTLMVDGKVYGHSGRGGWVCLDMADGKVLWSERAKLPGGSITCADGRLYCFTEGQGIAALVELSAEGFKEHGRLMLPKKSAQRQPRGQIWTPPVVSGGMLYLRDQDLLFAYDIRAAK